MAAVKRSRSPHLPLCAFRHIASGSPDQPPVDTPTATTPTARWELYRLLGEPVRLRLLALAAEDELSVGELAELIGEAQPNVSKHVAALRRAGLLAVRKQGNRALVSVGEVTGDAVVRDALAAGRALVTEDGSLARVPEIVRARDAASRAFFDEAASELEPDSLPPELPAYLAALAPLVPHRELAVDVGTGDGRMLDVLAPVFAHVVAIDRSARQLARAKKRVLARGYANVELAVGELDDASVRRLVRKHDGADVVFASRMLHHAAQPQRTLEKLGELARPGGSVVVIDYIAHEDEALREQQADVWLGFDPIELRDMARAAGLSRPEVRPLPSLLHRGARTADAHVAWQVLVARRPA
jgi:DNA-binding transcriptional ArsR family regulator